MSDAKYFARGKVQELREDLALDKKDAKQSRRRHALKKVVANMTMGNDMSPLFHDVLGCMNMPVLEIKKMVYLYLITYGKHKPDMALSAVGTLSRDAMDENPLIRALALRTFGNIPVEKVSESLCETLRRSLTDKDPYVCKTAALCVAKLFFYNESLAQREGFLGQLKSLLNHDNPTVVANALAALMDISARSKNVDFRLDVALANKLLSALDECNEWSQIYILESIMTVVPDDPNDAELLADRISPRLQHSNSAVVLTAIRIMLYLSNYIRNEAVVLSTFKKLGPPLVTLLHNTPEVQYVALRNILLVLQRQPDFLHSDLKVFFCKYNDPIYVKLAKLEIMFRLTTDKNIDIVLPELKEYAAEVDVDFVRKAVRSIGRCAIKIEKSSDKCIEALVDLVATKVNYVVQEAIVVIKDIFRKYPNRYESIIGTLCENLDSLDEPEAKASMIWIIGQYSDRIENADELLIQFLDTFKEDTAEVQLSLLTAIVKLFIKRPAVGQDLVPKVLKFATEEVDNPDLRDRGFIYWRLLSTDPVAAKAIILSDKPPITTESDNMDGGLLNQLLYNVSTLASLTHRPPAMPAGLLTRLSKFRTATFTSTGTPTSDNASASGSPSKPSAEPIVPAYQDMNNRYRDEDLHAPRTNVAMSQNLMDLLDLSNDQEDNEASSATQAQAQSQYAQIGGNNLLGMPYGAPSPSASMGVGMGMGGINNLAGVGAYGGVGASMVSSANNPFGAPAQLQSTPAASAHNPFGAPQSVARLGDNTGMMGGDGGLDLLGLGGTMAAPTAMPALQPLASPSRGLVPQSVGVSSNPIVDPFAKTSTGATLDGMGSVAPPSVGGIADDLFSLALTSGYVAPKALLLTAQLGRGLEVQGTFSRARGIMSWELVLTNKALQPLNDFAIALNKNSFGLCLAAPLDVRNALFPNQSLEVSIKLKIDGLPVLSTPVNNLQVAFKTNAGIVYFQTLVPLYLLFQEQGQLPPQIWLKMWKEEIPNESTCSIPFSKPDTLVSIRAKLQANNVFTVAERLVNGLNYLYLSARLEDGTVFLSEMRLEATSMACFLTTKSYGAHLFEAYQAGLTSILS